MLTKETANESADWLLIGAGVALFIHILLFTSLSNDLVFILLETAVGLLCVTLGNSRMFSVQWVWFKFAALLIGVIMIGSSIYFALPQKVENPTAKPSSWMAEVLQEKYFDNWS